MIQVFQIQTEFLHPESRTFPHRSGLSRLKMGECQCRQVFILLRKRGQLADYVNKLFFHKLQCLCHNDNIRVISYITGSSPQMDDSLRLRALYAIGVHMAHHVVAHFFFSCTGHIIVDIFRMGFQFFDLLISNGQSQLLFRLRQSNPKLPPCPKFHVRRKDILHLPAGIALGERTVVSVCTHKVSFVVVSFLSSDLRFDKSRFCLYIFVIVLSRYFQSVKGTILFYMKKSSESWNARHSFSSCSLYVALSFIRDKRSPRRSRSALFLLAVRCSFLHMR